MAEQVEVRRGDYRDSVSLMQASRTLAGRPGVQAALVAMGTELNLALLADLGFAVPAGAGPNDLLVAVRAADPETLEQARAAAEQALAGRAGPPPAAGAEPAPRTTGAALRPAPADLVLVSVPGEHAFPEAYDALAGGASVLIFSDNVPVEQEVWLKDEAARRGLLVMGPDCGTARLGGVGLGFANAVSDGPVGIVAASGTGAQQLMCLLDAAGTGVGPVLGVGGRDLSAAVGGRGTLAALARLAADPAIELIVVVSKPPDDGVAARVRGAAGSAGKPVRFALLGPGQPDLTAAAEAVLGALGRPVPGWPAWRPATPVRPRRGALRGLFAGGTLCDEAMVIASASLGPVHSNIPLRPEWALGPDLRAPGHLMLDFGDDALTRGRAHPMIDPTLRLERLRAEAADPGTAVLLLDVVLGFAADPDPAATLAPAVADAVGRGVAVVVSLCGTPGDPQDRDAQAGALAGAGAAVFGSNAAAARHAVRLVGEGGA